jgi:hypothetical protein
MRQRSIRYLAIAADHSAMETYLARPYNASEEVMADGKIWTQQERIELFRNLRLKYERAARYPWLSVEPDPELPHPLAGFDIQAMEGR